MFNDEIAFFAFLSAIFTGALTSIVFLVAVVGPLKDRLDDADCEIQCMIQDKEFDSRKDDVCYCGPDVFKLKLEK